MSMVVQAETGDRYNHAGSDNWIATGGINSYDEIKATNKQETELLEQTLIQDNYIQVSGKGRTISDAEYEQFMQDNRLWFVDYAETEGFDMEYRKIYIYKPVYDDYMTDKFGTTGVETYTIGELIASTVVIDYATWEYSEKAGTFDDEINDKIPDFNEAGWLEIHSPIDCEIVIWNADINRYYLFYVKKKEPLLVKLKSGSYHLTEFNRQTINNRVTDNGEDALPFHNRLQIRSWNTKEEPYLLDFTNIVVKYDFKDIIMPEHVDDIDPLNRPEISKEQTQVYTSIEEKESSNRKSTFAIVLLVSIIVLLMIYCVVIVKKRTENDEQ